MKSFYLAFIFFISYASLFAQSSGSGTESDPYYLSGNNKTHAVIDKNGIWTIVSGLASITTGEGGYTLQNYLMLSVPDTNGYIFKNNAESLTIENTTNTEMNSGNIDFGINTNFKNTAILEIRNCETISGTATFFETASLKISNGTTSIMGAINLLAESTGNNEGFTIYSNVTLASTGSLMFATGRTLNVQSGSLTVNGTLSFLSGSSANISTKLEINTESVALSNLTATYSSIISANNLAIVGTNSLSGSLTVNGALKLTGNTTVNKAVVFNGSNSAKIELNSSDVILNSTFIDSTSKLADLSVLADTSNSLDLSSSTHYKFAKLTLESGASLSLYMDYNTTVEIEGSIYLDSKSSLKIYGFQEHMIQVEEELFDGNLTSIQAFDQNGTNLGDVSIIGGYLSLTTVPEPTEWATIFGAIGFGFAIYRRRH